MTLRKCESSNPTKELEDDVKTCAVISKFLRQISISEKGEVAISDERTPLDTKTDCPEKNNGVLRMNECVKTSEKAEAPQDDQIVRGGSVKIYHFNKNKVNFDKDDGHLNLLSSNVHLPKRLIIKLCCIRNMFACIKDLIIPSVTHNNIKLLGSEMAVEKERVRFRNYGYIIHPLSKFRKCWDLSMMAMMTCSLFIFPLDIAFFTDNWNIFNIFSDVMCVTDILLNFCTSYHHADEKVYQLESKKIAKHYLKTWFVVDLVSSFPFHHIFLVIYGDHESVSRGLKGASRALKFLRIIKLLSLIKLLRLSRLIRSVHQCEEVYRITTGVMRYVKLLSLMLLVAHWNGCLHFLIPMLQDFPKNCWVNLCGVREDPWYIQYGWSLFKTLSHMLSIGYGRFTPLLLSEALITMFTMVTGATFYALFVANCMAYIIENDHSQTSYVEKLRQINEYLHHQNVPENLKNKVDIYFGQKYAQGRSFNENAVLSEISKPLRDDIIRYTCRDLVEKLPFLNTATPEIISIVLNLVSSDVYLTDEFILREGSLETDFYFVRTGKLDITVNERLIETISDGAYFGEVSVLTEQRRLYSVKANTTCNLFCFPGSKLKKALNDHASMRPSFEHAAIERILRIYCQTAMHHTDKDEVPTASLNAKLENDDMMKLCEKLKISLLKLMEGSKIFLKQQQQQPSNENTLHSDVEKIGIKKLFLLLGNFHQNSHETCEISTVLSDSIKY